MQRADIQAILYRRVNGGFRAATLAARAAQDPDLMAFLKEALTRAFNRSGCVAAVKLAQTSCDDMLMKHVLQLAEANALAKHERHLAEARAKQQALLAKARRQGYASPVLVYACNPRGVPKFKGFIETGRRWTPPAFLIAATKRGNGARVTRR